MIHTMMQSEPILLNEADYGDTSTEGKKWEDYETILCPDGTVIDMVHVLDDQARAMAALNHLAPMLGGFISKLRFIYTFRVPTQATDGYNVFVNPQFTASLDLAQKTFVMAHEIMHCLLNHMRRGAGMDPQKSNVAADYEVNYTLVDIGLFKEGTIKKTGGLFDEKYANMGMEAIYKALGSTPAPPPMPGIPGLPDNMDNSDDADKAEGNADQSEPGGGSNSQGAPQNMSDDFKAGWEQAMADYAAGKLKV